MGKMRKSKEKEIFERAALAKAEIKQAIKQPIQGTCREGDKEEPFPQDAALSAIDRDAPDELRILTEDGANLSHFQDEHHMHALQRAVCLDCRAVARYLLEHHKSEFSPWHRLAYIIKKWLRQGRRCQILPDMTTVLCIVEYNRTEVWTMGQGSYGANCLHLAVLAGNTPMARLILECLLPWQARQLCNTCVFGYPSHTALPALLLAREIEPDNYKMAELLLSHGADPAGQPIPLRVRH